MAKALVGTVNAGYTIEVQGDKAVIAHREGKYEEWVAWEYSINPETGKANYFWGRYGSKEYVIAAWEAKEGGKYSGDLWKCEACGEWKHDRDIDTEKKGTCKACIASHKVYGRY